MAFHAGRYGVCPGRNVKTLMDLGLVERTVSGTVCCPYGDIHVDMHLREAA